MSQLVLPILSESQTGNSLHHLNAKTIDGKLIHFSDFKGRKLILVNTASQCGLTPQYKDLEALYQEYKTTGLMIFGFPSNDFASQEPGNNEEIKSFCEKEYGVSFQMMEKITVKGDSIHPVYKFLTSKKENGVKTSRVKWNFQKYLVDEDGRLVNVVGPITKPGSKKIRRWLGDPPSRN